MQPTDPDSPSDDSKVVLARIILIVLIVLAVGGWLLYRHHHNSVVANPAVQTSNCSNDSDNSTAQVNSFIHAYKHGGTSSLTVITGCGTPMNGGMYTAYNLSVANKKLSDSQFSYADASPPGPTTKHSCSLVVNSKTKATVTCGSDSFDLYDQ